MWKRLLLALVTLIVMVGGLGLYLANQIYLRHDHQTVSPAEFDHPWAPDAIRADVDYLIGTLRRIHPDFESIGGAVYERRARQLADTLSRPMTRIEFYRHLAPFNRFLSDGHTSLRVPAEERDAYLASGGLLLPFTVTFMGSGLNVERMLADDLNLEPGAELDSINGIDASELARFALASQSGESVELRRAYAQRFFQRDMWAFGVTSPFEIKLAGVGLTTVIHHRGITREQYLARRDQTTTTKNSYRLLEPGVGLLTFSDMPSPDAAFRGFLESTFATIEQDNVKSLIIDIRENGGGDSRAGDALMAYLTERDLPAIDYVDVKVTQEIKDYYKTLLPPGFRWIPLHRFVEVLEEIDQTDPGATFRLYPDAGKPNGRKSRLADAFDGRLYVLIGPRTYSSAVIFAAPSKHFGRATFVGDETGEPLIFYGENYYFDLPNSKLEAQVSHKKFVLVGAKDDISGIIPDQAAGKGQDALDVVLDLISRTHNSGQAPAQVTE